MSALYHFTAAVTSHLGSILTDGHIRTTESNLSFERVNAGPPVVWLTDNADADHAAHAWAGPLKLAARFTVDVDDAEPWGPFFDRHGGASSVRQGLVEAGGGEQAAAAWYVVERRIFSADWIALDLHDGRTFDAAELRHLTRSAGARRALALPKIATASANSAVWPGADGGGS